MTLPGQLGIILLFLDCIPLVDHGYLTQLQAGADGDEVSQVGSLYVR